MPRTKKAARRGNYHGGRGNRLGGLETSFVPIDGASSPRRGHNGFTLQEEARNTERHHSFWDSDQRLRHTKVNFVSAGPLDPTKAEDPEAALADMTLDSPGQEDETIEVYEEEAEDLQAEEEPSGPPSPKEEQAFVVDTQGSEPVTTGLAPPQLRTVSPTPSNSSEEVILFAGRDQQGRALSRAPQPSRKPADPIDAKIRIVEDKIHYQEELLEKVLQQTDGAASSSKSAKDSTESLSADFTAVSPKPASRKRRGRRSQRNGQNEEEEALIADYIANIDAEEGLYSFHNRRELGGTDDDVWQDETEASSGEAVRGTKKPFHSSWEPSDICDFDDLSTSDGVMGDVQAILSKRERVAGIQYLVVWEGQTVDEARWVPVTTLTSVNALTLIEAFEAEEKLVAEFINDEEDTSDTDDMEIDKDEDEDEDDEAGLVQRKIERMSDEKIARLLAKQEELGMGSAELMLFDDEADDGDEDVALPKNSFSPIMLTSKKKLSKGRGAKRPRGEFPAATALADAYDGFDVMDFDRPSLKKKPKGRKGKMAFDLSDSDLEASMQMAWENDRAKKKERKQDREELRAQGLLGRKNGKPDLKQKYKEGMGIHAVKEEIKNFLMGDNTTLALPPMDKTDRKVVHELANAFYLKSKSIGTGTKRFPVLYRTTRTMPFAERTFDAVEARLSRRFLPRMDVSSKKSGASKRVGRGGGFNSAAVSYRDGDIVGGSAPELGVENKGRAMLEKMGWSTGTALGALNNKGILQPVSHVVKTTKAGLG